jgi:hypothetical protein
MAAVLGMNKTDFLVIELQSTIYLVDISEDLAARMIISITMDQMIREK